MDVITCAPNDTLFTALTEKLYANTPYAHFPNPPKAHLQHCFVCTDKQKPVARAALFTNPNIIVKGKKMAQVGSFEAEENLEAVLQLFEVIGNHTRQLGFDGIIGPMNGSTWQAYRFNQTFENYFFTEYQHPNYYESLWQQADFENLAGYYSSFSLHPKKELITKALKIKNLTIRNLSVANYDQELNEVHAFCCKAFANNFLYTPISLRGFKDLYVPLKPILKEEFVLLAEDDGQLVGVLFGFEDKYKPQDERLIIKTLARLPDDKYKGIGHILSKEFYTRAALKGYQQIIHAFMLDSGSAEAVSANFGGTIFKRYNLHFKQF